MRGLVSIALSMAASVLAAVFVVAAGAKLLDPARSRAVASFGVPGQLAGPLGIGLAVVEFAIALLLLPAATRWSAAVAALALLVVFSLAIAIALARGKQPECRCFGQLHAAPVGRRTLARNAGLAAIALAVVAAGRDDAGADPIAWARGLDGVEGLALALGAALVALVAAGGYAVGHVLRSYGRVLVRLEVVEARLREVGLDFDHDAPGLGLASGTPAPAFWLPAAIGDRVALDDLLALGRPLVLLFTSPSCAPCAALLPQVADWQREHADALTLAVLSDGDPEVIRSEAAEHGLEHVLSDATREVADAYGVQSTPSAVLVGTDGSIASGLAIGPDWIASLVDEALDGSRAAPGLPLGSEAPDVHLERVGGGRASASSLVDGPTVVLFWNPDCGFCRSMRAAVLEWETDRPEGAPDVVVISSGEADDVVAEGFRSPVLLDPLWEAAAAFGAGGTPSAVLVDGAGRIAGPVLPGADAVLTLLGANHSIRDRL